MLSYNEKKIFSSIDFDELENDLKFLSSFNRLSGSPGEKKAGLFLQEKLNKSSIQYKTHHFPSLLSNPLKAEFICHLSTGNKSIQCKTWSFSHSTNREKVCGSLIFIEKEEFESNPILFLSGRKTCNRLSQKLKGKIVIAQTYDIVNILSAQAMGATAFVICWPNGDEELIHEGIVNMIWGTPEPGEIVLYPHIPIVTLSRPVGKKLIEKVNKENIYCSIRTELEEKVTDISVIEAVIPPQDESPYFMLIGSHLDSWHSGATDNATGNALSLLLAKTVASLSDRKYGVRICWWSGHSNGRYAGSSAYATGCFQNLYLHCLAYTNIDMPGLHGADDFTRVTAGQELITLAQSVIYDITGQTGKYEHNVRGWDQSFQNMGISPYLIWSSTLPDKSKYKTGDSFMSWWWHTEKDSIDYYDPKILFYDAKIYILAILRAISGDGIRYNISSLMNSVKNRFIELESLLEVQSKSVIIHEEFENIYNILTNLFAKREIPLKLAIPLIRKLNQIYYTFKGCHLQDWAISSSSIPGLSYIVDAKKRIRTEIGKLIVEYFKEIQLNRIFSLAQDILSLLEIYR